MWGEDTDLSVAGIGDEDLAISIHGEVEGGIDAHETGGEAFRTDECEHLSLGAVELDAEDALFGGDDVAVGSEGDIGGVTASAEAVGGHAGFAPEGEEFAVEGVGFNAELSRMRDEDIAVGVEETVEMYAGDDEFSGGFFGVPGGGDVVAEVAVNGEAMYASCVGVGSKELYAAHGE